MANFFNSGAPTVSEPRTFVTINGTDMRTYGLELTEYKIGAPEPVINLIDVPGRMGKLDATEALNGYVTYSGRQIELQFHVRASFADWHTLISVLSAAYDGVESRVVFSKDPDWYYKGRFSIDFRKSNPVSGDIVLTCMTAFPFKLQMFEETVEMSNGSRRTYNYHPTQSGWMYISEVVADKTTATHSASKDDVMFDTYMTIGGRSKTVYINMIEDEKKYYAYYGIGQVQSASVFAIALQPYYSDFAGTAHFKFEAGVF